MFNKYLRSLFQDQPSLIEEAELYTLMAGGKRIRPELLFSVLRDNELDERIGYPYAAAIEMIHTYSLIHDDLPAMDNDDMRRNKPTNHKVYGEDIAILAGDALLTKAFEILSKQKHEYLLKIIREIAIASGDKGMIYGQVLDLTNENKEISFDELKLLDQKKTGELITIPLIVGAYLSNCLSDLPLLKEIGYRLGLAFQIQDDIFEYTKSEKEMGKSLSDAKNEKATYVKLLGLKETKELCTSMFNDTYKYVNRLSYEANNLIRLIKTIVDREY